MVKNLTDKNPSMENTDSETIVEKKIKKKKSKLVVNKNDGDSIKLNEKKYKRKNFDKDDVDTEKAAKAPKIASENDTAESIEVNENDETKKSGGPSKREIKRMKIAQKDMEMREQNRQEATQKALNYLSMWKHARNEWKFTKVRQIWLIDHLLDEQHVPDSIFPTVLEYFEGCKGMARETLLKKGMDVIKKNEQKLEESEDIIETVELTRARQLLKVLPTET